MANQMQPTSSRSNLPGLIYAIFFTLVGGTLFLSFCGSAVERAVQQVDEINECRDDTDACNAPADPQVPNVEGLPPNADGTPYGTCRARYPMNETGALPPDGDFDANLTAPSHCIYVQTPSGAVVAAYAYNDTGTAPARNGGGGGLNWGGAIRVFLFLAVLIFGWFFWGKWRRAKRRRKELATLGTQPIDPATGGPRLPVPVPVPGAPDDDDFDDDDDELE